MKYKLIHSALHLARTTGFSQLLEPLMGGMGAILTLHHVRPFVSHEFAPNRILEITPEFLAELISGLKMQGYEFISMDEVAHRLQHPHKLKQRFIAVTLDDAYRDNLEHAVPVFNAFNVPFCIFVPTAFPSGEGILWWIGLEEFIRTHDEFVYENKGVSTVLPTLNTPQKQAAWAHIYSYIKSLPEIEAQEFFLDFAERYDYDFATLNKNLVMNWQELQDLSKNPLCTLGAHTHTHCSLKQSTTQQAIYEMEHSREILHQQMGVRPKHIAYPYGGLHDADAHVYKLAHDLGFASGVTTRPGVITQKHAQNMHGLPRISVNGLFQSLTEMNTLISGFPVRLLNN